MNTRKNSTFIPRTEDIAGKSIQKIKGPQTADLFMYTERLDRPVAMRFDYLLAAMTFMATSTTCCFVKPNFSKSCAAGAEAPKLSMQTVAPSRPT